MTDLITKPNLVVVVVKPVQALVKVFPAVGHIGLTGAKGDKGETGAAGPSGTTNHTLLANKNDEADVQHLTAAQVALLHASGSDNQDLSGKVDKVTGSSLVPDTEISKIHVPATEVDTESVAITLTGQQISASVIPGGVDHGSLAGLADDDHTQYLKADGLRPLTGDWDAGSSKKISVGEISVTGSILTGTVIGLENNEAATSVVIEDKTPGLFFQRQLPISKLVGNDPDSWSINYSNVLSPQQSFDVVSGQYRPYVTTSGSAIITYTADLFRPKINAFMSSFDTALITAKTATSPTLMLNNPITLSHNGVTVYCPAKDIGALPATPVLTGLCWGAWAILFDNAGALTAEAVHENVKKVSGITFGINSSLQLTDTASGFLAALFSSGDTVTMSGFTTGANNTTKIIAGVTANTITFTSTTGLIAEAVGATVRIISAGNKTSTGTTYTINASKELEDSGSGFVTSGFIVGDFITMSGWVNGANNVTKTIATVAANKITFTSPTSLSVEGGTPTVTLNSMGYSNTNVPLSYKIKGYTAPITKGLLGFLLIKAKTGTTWTPATSNINETDALYAIFMSQVLPNNNRYLKGKMTPYAFSLANTPYLSQLSLTGISAISAASVDDSFTHLNFLSDSLPVDTKKHVTIIKAIFPSALPIGNASAMAIVGITDQGSMLGGIYVGLIQSPITDSNSNITVMTFDIHDFGGYPSSADDYITYFNPTTAIPFHATAERTIVIITHPTSNYWEVWIDGVFICSKNSTRDPAGSGSGTMTTPDFSGWILGSMYSAVVRVTACSGKTAGSSQVKCILQSISTLAECWE